MTPTETEAAPAAIMRTPGVCGGRACIRTTRIPVWALISARRLGATDEQVLTSYPSLAASDLAAAWDYYRSHAQEVDADVADQERDD